MSSPQQFFTANSDFCKQKGLRKIPLQINKQYKPSGIKSYAYLLNKFSIDPTKPGPYCREKRAEQRGLSTGAPVGGRCNLVSQLVRKDAASDKTLGFVPAEDQQNDALYLSPVQIGTPPQTLMLDFDTGSSDLWVFSTELPAALQKGHVDFDPSKSSTFKNMPGYTWSISYGDGSSASGNCGSDTVGLGGLNVEGQCVELAQKLSDSFAKGVGDGLLGLGFSNINTVRKNGQPDPQPTVVTNMIAQKDIPQNAELFTSCMYSERDPGTESFYTFGYVDDDLVKSSGTEIYWTPIDSSNGWWQFPSTSAFVNDKAINQSGNTAIADTGTTLALVSDEVCDALYAAIPGATYSSTQQGYLIPISVTPEQMPKFSVAVGERQFVIQPEDLVFAPVDNKYWYGGVQSRGNNPFDILGDAFLKSIYAIWDQGNERFGAVPKIQKVQNLTPPSA